MKTKLISLLIALLCMTMLLVSCSDPCVEHIDADKDGICDVEGCEDAVKVLVADPHDHVDADANNVCDVENCGAIMIVNTVEKVVEIIVPTKPEEKIPMVVKPIPVDVNSADYVNLDFAEKQAYFNSLFKKYNADDYSGTLDSFVVIKKVTVPVNNPDKVDNTATPDVNEADDYKDVYSVIDISGATELVILTHTTEVYERGEYMPSPAIMFSPDGNYIVVSYDGYEKQDIYKAGVANTEPMFKLIDEENEDEEDATRVVLEDYTFDKYVTYFTFDGVTYAYDNETYALLVKGPKDLFVKRPVFDEIKGNVGYFYDNDSVEVYDLTKWIECVYVYEVPANASAKEVFELANGTYLYQYKLMLPNNAVSYDLIEGNTKYDVVYEIVNPEAKTATKVEFGYWISNLVDEEHEEFKYDGKNIFEVYEIVDGRTAQFKILITDNEMNVLFEIKDLVVNQDGDYYELVADKFALVNLYVGNSIATASVNLETGAVTYLPANYTRYNTCFRIGSAFYTYDGAKKIDFEGYRFVKDYSNYLILSKDFDKLDGAGQIIPGEKETKYFYYDVNGTAAPVQIANYDGIIDSSSDMFILRTAKTAAENGNATVYEYNVYNCDGTLVTTIAEAVNYVSYVDYYEDEGIYKLVLNIHFVEENNSYNEDVVYLFNIAPAQAPAA